MSVRSLGHCGARGDEGIDVRYLAGLVAHANCRVRGREAAAKDRERRTTRERGCYGVEGGGGERKALDGGQRRIAERRAPSGRDEADGLCAGERRLRDAPVEGGVKADL